MRLLKNLTSTAFLLLCGALAILPAHAAGAADNPARQRVCKPCTMPLLPVALPRHGMVLARGTIVSAASTWYTADLERGEASRFVAHEGRTAHTLDVVERATRPIPDEDLAALTKIAGAIWASADPLPNGAATDVQWDLWQLDGDDVRRDFGAGVPAGLAQEAERILARLVPAPPPAPVPESLFVAHVDRITLTRRGGPYCADLCPSNGRRNPDGSTSVCISNDGGCQKTEFVADRVLLGDTQPGPHTLDARIGEWGGTQFPIGYDTILVHERAGVVEWAPILDVGGRQRVLVQMFRRGGTVGGVDLRALAQGREDGVELATLIDHLPGKR